jgi:hypothetical protein
MSMEPKELVLLGTFIGAFLFVAIGALIASASVRGRHRRASSHR